MASEEQQQGVDVCQYRSNVWENVQVSDFSKVNYYEAPVSEGEDEQDLGVYFFLRLKKDRIRVFTNNRRHG